MLDGNWWAHASEIEAAYYLLKFEIKVYLKGVNKANKPTHWLHFQQIQMKKKKKFLCC